jgi:MarR family transcriptional regulator, 2-MHQ and catechol-resistance regulon repressor
MERTCKSKPYLLLMQTAKAIQDRIKTEMSKNQLNITEFSVLEVLFQKGMQTIHQINQSILISSGSMTYVIDKLEQRGLLRRNDCPNDRRAIDITLTQDGIHLMKEIMPEHEKIVEDLFDSLNEEEREHLSSLLKKLKIKKES